MEGSLVSLVRTSCSCCDKALFWGDDDSSEPECMSCRELREAADAGPEVVAGEPARLPAEVVTLLGARPALR